MTNEPSTKFLKLKNTDIFENDDDEGINVDTLIAKKKQPLKKTSLKLDIKGAEEIRKHAAEITHSKSKYYDLDDEKEDELEMVNVDTRIDKTDRMPITLKDEESAANIRKKVLIMTQHKDAKNKKDSVDFDLTDVDTRLVKIKRKKVSETPQDIKIQAEDIRKKVLKMTHHNKAEHNLEGGSEDELETVNVDTMIDKSKTKKVNKKAIDASIELTGSEDEMNKRLRNVGVHLKSDRDNIFLASEISKTLIKKFEITESELSLLNGKTKKFLEANYSTFSKEKMKRYMDIMNEYVKNKDLKKK